MTDRKAILITGAARRLGRESALYLAQAGYDIIIHYHRSEADAHSLQRDISDKGGQAHLLQAKLGPQTDYMALMARAKQLAPNLYGLVHNASIFEQANFTQTSVEQYDHHMDLHVKAPFFLTQAFAAQVKEGVVISMLDTYITKYSQRYFTYLLSKKTMAEMTRMLARELAPTIRVNAIAPGIILPSGDDLGEQVMKEKQAIIPLRKLGEPRDIAQALHWLLTQDYLTGQILYIDGGEQLL